MSELLTLVNPKGKGGAKGKAAPKGGARRGEIMVAPGQYLMPSKRPIGGDNAIKPKRRKARRNPSPIGTGKGGAIGLLKMGGGVGLALAIDVGARKVFGSDGALSPWIGPVASVAIGALVAPRMLGPEVAAGMIGGGVTLAGVRAVNRFKPGLLAGADGDAEGAMGALADAPGRIPVVSRDAAERFLSQFNGVEVGPSPDLGALVMGEDLGDADGDDGDWMGD